MLHNTETIRAIVSTWTSAYPTAETRPLLVVDPVMVSTSGHRLLEPAAEATLMTDLLPLASLVTPNLPEAAILAGWADKAVESEDDMRQACKEIARRGVANVLVKGGHAKGGSVIVDILYEAKDDRFTALRHE